MIARIWWELLNVKSISNYDAICFGSARYAEWHGTEARRSKLFALLTPRLRELAGNIVTT